MRDRMGNVNSHRLLVSWRFVSKLNNVRPSLFYSLIGDQAYAWSRRGSVMSPDQQRRGSETPSKAPSTPGTPANRAKRYFGTKLIFDGTVNSFNEHQVKCIREEELLDKMACAGPNLDESELVQSLLFQKRIFHMFNQQVQFQKWDRIWNENPVKQWWEEPTGGVPVRTLSRRSTSSKVDPPSVISAPPDAQV